MYEPQKEYMDLCMAAYEKAVIELRQYEDLDAVYKGYIVTRNIKRKTGDTICVYTSSYLQTVEYVDGKRIQKRKHIPESRLAHVKEMLARNKSSIKLLKDKMEYWEGKLAPFIKKGLINFEELSELIASKIELLKDIEKHRAQSKLEFENSYQTSNEHTAFKYNIITVCNENVRSKTECIFANIFYLHDIPYYYEKKLSIKTFDYYYPYKTIKPDFTIFINGSPIYVEILGMTDDSEYSDHWKVRESVYNINGIERGKDLICFSCKGNNINSALINDMVIKIKAGYRPTEIICAD